ncbi:MAG: lamin tail domain-containing protein [Candidatus Eisenbacteria bacterium]
MTRGRYLLTALALLSLLAIRCVGDGPVRTHGSDSDVVLFINELVSRGDPDWVEIYNPNDTAIDVGGFLVYDDGTADDEYSLPAGTTVPAGGYLVLDCDDLGTGLNTNFKLSAGGESIFLEDGSHNLIDTVTFPALDEGTSYGRMTDGSDQWTVLTTPTRGAANDGIAPNAPPDISSVTRSPQSPTPADGVVITATVTDDYGLQSVVLHFDTTGTAYVDAPMTSIGGDQFEAAIPAMPDSAVVKYYIEAADDSSESSVDPSGAPSTYYSYISLASAHIPPALRINEFLASNDSCCTDEFGDHDDFIEIYNADGTTVDIGGMYITDDLTAPTAWQIPATAPDSTSIPPGGFLVLWADKESEQGILHVELKLSGNGEQVGLFTADIYGNAVIDTVTFGPQSADTSFGRHPDGSDSWQVFDAPTPGASNN